MITNAKSQEGYVALITLIIIGAIVLIAAIALTFGSLSQDNFIISHNRSLQNYYQANACANYAILRLQQNLDYAGNENLNLAGISCQIGAVSSSGSARIFIVSSQQGNQIKKIQVDLDQVRPVTIIKSESEIFQ